MESSVLEINHVPTENSAALKHLFNAKLVQLLSEEIQKHAPQWDAHAFCAVSDTLISLEMKARVARIAQALYLHLPQDYVQALAILHQVLRGGRLTGFAVWPIAHFIEHHGLSYPEASLETLKLLTVHFTSEWAVRPYLVRYPEHTLTFLLHCTQDESEHVRRWASEGARPRLPWGARLHSLILDPKPVLPILCALKHDDSLYVRKSVANHLNDIAHDHPACVLALLAEWQAQAIGTDAQKMQWIIRHALRNLIKAGHPQALSLIGVEPALVEVEAVQIACTDILLGEALNFKVTLRSTVNYAQKLVVDYKMHFLKANGATSEKVFKLKTFILPAKATLTLTKTHSIKRITTRQYYAGDQALEIQINGCASNKMAWRLSLEPD
jgi:3-methyladenine DNA glycosylase AlkC